MTEDTIFGYSWDEIQAMQQGKFRGRAIQRHNDNEPDRELLERDKFLLEENGEQWLIDQQFNGTLERLRRAGVLSYNAKAQLPPEREARREPKARQRFGRSTAAICWVTA